MAAISKKAALLAAAIAVGATAVVFGGAAVAGAISARAPQITAFRGARLGMSARDVRDHFEPLGPGHWQTQTAADPGEIILAWAADAGDARARFEFHSGMLVAVRATLPAATPLASGPPLETSPAAVLTRAPAEPGQTAITILARDCPTHAAEVQRVLAAFAPR